jgi:hypothetical protein
MNTNNVSFILTSEELFYALRVSQLSNIPGLGVDPFKGIEEDLLEKIMEIAFRVLVARQLLIPEENKGFRLDKVLNATLSVCAEPEKMVALMFGEDQEPGKTIYFYSASELDVKYDVLFPGMHQFQIDANVDLGEDMIFDVLSKQPEGLSEAKLAGSAYTVNNKEFETAREKAIASVEEGSSKLIELGIDSAQADDLANIFAKPEFRFTIQSLYRSDDTPHHSIVSTISANNSWWLIQADSPSSETLVIENVTKETVLHTIEKNYLALGL